jgi:O-antigen ligase
MIILIISNWGFITKNKLFLMLSFSIIFITLIGVINNGSNIGTIFGITNLSLALLISSQLKISNKEIISLSFLFFIFSIYWIALRPIEFNTNSHGLIALICYICSMFFITSVKNKLMKFSILVLFTVSIINTVLESESRSSLIGLMVFIILCFVLPSNLWINSAGKIVAHFFITYGSLIYVFVYVYIWKNNSSVSIEFTEKKFFTGRELIWNELWNAFKEHPILGIGSNFSLQSFFVLNVHNSIFHILTIYGGLVFFILIYQLWLFLNLYSFKKSKDNPYFKLALSGIIALSIQSYFETTLISSVFLPAILLLLIVFSSTGTKKISA